MRASKEPENLTSVSRHFMVSQEWSSPSSSRQLQPRDIGLNKWGNNNYVLKFVADETIHLQYTAFMGNVVSGYKVCWQQLKAFYLWLVSCFIVEYIIYHSLWLKIKGPRGKFRHNTRKWDAAIFKHEQSYMKRTSYNYCWVKSLQSAIGLACSSSVILVYQDFCNFHWSPTNSLLQGLNFNNHLLYASPPNNKRGMVMELMKSKRVFKNRPNVLRVVEEPNKPYARYIN